MRCISIYPLLVSLLLGLTPKVLVAECPRPELYTPRYFDRYNHLQRAKVRAIFSRVEESRLEMSVAYQEREVGHYRKLLAYGNTTTLQLEAQKIWLDRLKLDLRQVTQRIESAERNIELLRARLTEECSVNGSGFDPKTIALLLSNALDEWEFSLSAREESLALDKRDLTFEEAYVEYAQKMYGKGFLVKRELILAINRRNILAETVNASEKANELSLVTIEKYKEFIDLFSKS